MSLKDIAPISESVIIRGDKIAVKGITNEGISVIWRRFPVVTELLSGTATIDTIAVKAPEAIAAIIAAGCGFPGDEEAEAIAANLTVDESTALLSSILAMTWPRGFGPFVESLTRLGLLVQQPASSNGKLKTDGTSPEALKP